MSTAETLRKARDLYASAPSHAPATAMPTPGTYCVVMALGGVALMYEPAADAFRRAVGVDRDFALIEWNAEVTTAEVVAMFDRAIANEEAREQEHNAPAPVEFVA